MPRREYHFWVYILASRSRILYTGVTNNLLGRTGSHAKANTTTHTGKYRIHRLVYFEHFTYILNAITREKVLKHYTRAQKIALIEAANPTWQDLAPTQTPDPK